MAIIRGTLGNDKLYGTNGDDEIYGGYGNDILNGRSGAADYLVGGQGNDVYYVTYEQNTVVEELNGGIDHVNSSAAYYSMNGNVENMTLIGRGEQGSGNDLANIIMGNDCANVIYGNGSADTISGGGGNDAINGGTGADWIRGGLGSDYLLGGSGADKFAYYSVAEAEGDAIRDFQGISFGATNSDRDRIDLHRIDANAGTIGDNIFRFVGDAALSHQAGELRVIEATVTVTDSTPVYADNPYTGRGYLVQGDTNEDGAADFQITVVSTAPLQAADFYL